MLLADFHIHTRKSGDSNLSVDAILKKASAFGLNVLGIVDHNRLFRERVGGKITVFRGEEIKTAAGEIIGFELKKDIEPGLDLIETCKQIKKQGGIVYVPHPFDSFRQCIGDKIYDIVDYIDIVEGFNSRCTFSRFNKMAEEFAKEHNIPLVNGSDAHFDYEIGSCITTIKSTNIKADILKAIRSGNILIEGRDSGLMPHFHTFKFKITKKVG
jgi:predicted metal-dependent phosphoesterase TrpH